MVNAWREIPPAERGAATTPILPPNVVEFATNTNVALISGSEMFKAVAAALTDPTRKSGILNSIPTTAGIFLA